VEVGHTGDAALALLVLDPGSPGELAVPVHERLFVGRECAGIEASRRLIIDDETVSRNHFEIRLDVQDDRALVVDTSTNGTRLNGSRIERAAPVLLRPGDRLTVGKRVLEFRSDHFRGGGAADRYQTLKQVELTSLAMVVGDIITYSTISQYTDDIVLMGDVNRVYGELCEILNKHKGTLNNYVGDAFFAIWEVEQDPEAARNAVRFALEASQRVHDVGSSLALRDPNGDPVRMGWGVALGKAAVSSMTGMLVAVLGDAANLAFRISGIAGRDGRDEVVVTSSLYEATKGDFAFGPPEEVTVKGRTGTETVYGVSG
jgi:adenylate cyclase